MVLLVLFLPLYTLSEGMNLPEGLLSIDEETFAQDPAIQKVMIAEGTRTIGPGAFSGCTGLSEITLPASLESIDETAFEGCGQLCQAAHLGLPVGLGQGIYGKGNRYRRSSYAVYV